MSLNPRAGHIAISVFIPGSFWVVITNHGVIPTGQRFLVVEQWDDWWLAWENGVVPRHKGTGTLLQEQHFRREEPEP